MNPRVRQLLLRPPTIRTLVAFWASSLLIAWVILVGGWFVAKNQLTRIETQVTDDIQAMDATHRLEAAILSYRHDDLLWHSSDQNRYQEDERKSLATAEQIAHDFVRYVSTPNEEELLAKIETKLAILRGQLSIAAPGPTQIEAGSTFDLLGVVHDLQLENEGQMEASIRAANRVQDEISAWAMGLSAGTALVLFVGALSLIRRIVRPALALTKAAESFGEGDFSAQAPVLHGDEMGDLARTFNNMAGDIADREKNRLEFVAMVVHDLKNPVLAVDLAARLLQGSGATEDERRGYLKGIQQETVHLRGIIRDLTDDIQVANGRFSIQKVEVDLGTLVRQFTETQGRAFTGHEIVVTTDEGCTIEGDARRLERVVMNLVSNAVKYSPQDTCVTVRVWKDDSQVVLTVSDQGPGIAEEDLGVLFQPFGRGRSADALAEGTGMGLYVVKQIVEAHGGRIDVQSELGHGATFRVRLPLAPSRGNKNSSILLKIRA